MNPRWGLVSLLLLSLLLHIVIISVKCRHSVSVRRLDRGAKVPGSIPTVVNYTG